MRVLLFLIRKEFLQIFRNKVLFRAIFFVPLVQMLVLVPAVTFEIRNVSLVVTDFDKSIMSRDLISDIQGSGFFTITKMCSDETEAMSILEKGDADIRLTIPSGF